MPPDKQKLQMNRTTLSVFTPFPAVARLQKAGDPRRRGLPEWNDSIGSNTTGVAHLSYRMKYTEHETSRPTISSALLSHPCSLFTSHADSLYPEAAHSKFGYFHAFDNKCNLYIRIYDSHIRIYEPHTRMDERPIQSDKSLIQSDGWPIRKDERSIRCGDMEMQKNVTSYPCSDSAQYMYS